MGKKCQIKIKVREGRDEEGQGKERPDKRVQGEEDKGEEGGP